MKTMCAAIIGLALTTSAFAADHDQAEAQKAVDTFAANYIKAFNAKDAAAIAAMFVDDGIEIPPNRPITGKDNIEKWFKSIFDGGTTGLNYDIKRVQPEGDVVLAVGQFTVKIPQNGVPKDMEGNFVNIYQWDGNDLKYRVHSYNLIPPQQ